MIALVGPARNPEYPREMLQRPVNDQYEPSFLCIEAYCRPGCAPYKFHCCPEMRAMCAELDRRSARSKARLHSGNDASIHLVLSERTNAALFCGFVMRSNWTTAIVMCGRFLWTIDPPVGSAPLWLHPKWPAPDVYAFGFEGSHKRGHRRARRRRRTRSRAVASSYFPSSVIAAGKLADGRLPRRRPTAPPRTANKLRISLESHRMIGQIPRG
jgi:hypothetical protein